MAEIYEHHDLDTGRTHQYVVLETAADVNQEVLDLATEIESGWFDGRRIEWDEFWERMEKHRLDSYDGAEIDMGSGPPTPAMRKIQKHIRDLRAQG